MFVLPSALSVTFEQDVLAVGVDNVPASGGANQGGDRSIRRAQEQVESIFVEKVLPFGAALAEGQVFVADLLAIVVVPAIEKNFLARVVAKDHVVGNLIRREDAPVREPAGASSRRIRLPTT